MNFSTPFLTEQLIAYIGNKRRLLPLIFRAMEATGLPLEPGLKFFDVFSGSGVVSRMAKSLGFEVFANDWEYYANVISQGYLATDDADIAEMFGSEGEFLALLDRINSLPAPDEDGQYIARYYAPREFDEDKADWNTERLFYTRRNALAIDKIRNYIEENFSSSPRAKNLLLANLVYESSTHTNTSGVFKAFHKGFGGHGRDALGRILAEIKLNRPVLIDSLAPVHIYQENANEIVRRIHGIDIAYLDPPYNQHQYGSNYHLLNTIAKWDHIPAPLELNEKGVLKEKAAIRHDWVNTRSDYCYREIAEATFADLVEHTDARRILVSYSTDGIIPFDRMREICMRKGRLSIVTNEYTTYRGGKKSASRRNANIEFVLCIDTEAESDFHSLGRIDAVLVRKRLLLLFRQRFCEKKLREAVRSFVPMEDGQLVGARIGEGTGGTARKRAEPALFFTTRDGREIEIGTRQMFELVAPESAEEIPTLALAELHSVLSPCACANKEEELAELTAKIRRGGAPLSLARKLPTTLKNLAHKKNRTSFQKWLRRAEKLEDAAPDTYWKIRDQLENVKRLAELRFTT